MRQEAIFDAAEVAGAANAQNATIRAVVASTVPAWAHEVWPELALALLLLLLAWYVATHPHVDTYMQSLARNRWFVNAQQASMFLFSAEDNSDDESEAMSKKRE